MSQKQQRQRPAASSTEAAPRTFSESPVSIQRSSGEQSHESMTAESKSVESKSVESKTVECDSSAAVGKEIVSHHHTKKPSVLRRFVSVTTVALAFALAILFGMCIGAMATLRALMTMDHPVLYSQLQKLATAGGTTFETDEPLSLVYDTYDRTVRDMNRDYEENSDDEYVRDSGEAEQFDESYPAADAEDSHMGYEGDIYEGGADEVVANGVSGGDESEQGSFAGYEGDAAEADENRVTEGDESRPGYYAEDRKADDVAMSEEEHRTNGESSGDNYNSDRFGGVQAEGNAGNH